MTDQFTKDFYLRHNMYNVNTIYFTWPNRQLANGKNSIIPYQNFYGIRKYCDLFWQLIKKSR